jgi:uncharacterized protein (DUF1697 family)
VSRWVVLLRGINVGVANKVPMARLRAALEAEGFADVVTYIQSGNVLLTSDAGADEIAGRVHALLAMDFAANVPVIVRTASQWATYAKGGVFRDAEVERPKLLHLGLSVDPPKADAAAVLQARAADGERVAAKGDAIWIDFNTAVARSKLTPAACDKAAGSPFTARNWNSVQAIARLLDA